MKYLQIYDSWSDNEPQTPELSSELTAIHNATSNTTTLNHLIPKLQAINDWLEDYEVPVPDVAQLATQAANLAIQNQVSDNVNNLHFFPAPYSAQKSNFFSRELLKPKNKKRLVHTTYPISKEQSIDNHVVLYENDVKNTVKWEVYDLFDFKDEVGHDSIDEEEYYWPWDLDFQIMDFRVSNALRFSRSLQNYSSQSREIGKRIEQTKNPIAMVMKAANMVDDNFLFLLRNDTERKMAELEKVDDVSFEDFLILRPLLSF